MGRVDGSLKETGVKGRGQLGPALRRVAGSERVFFFVFFNGRDE